ncbi:MAG: TetR/AcrR family transcriptional regulator [Proteiniphilum sp.]|jgi:AcrR family transcriptional regulator
MSDVGTKEVKNIIVESAAFFFSKYGFYKTTMDEIAQHIHKAKGALYYYFKSKEELFNEVLKQELGIVKISLQKIVNKENDPMVMFKEYMLHRFQLLNNSLNYHETLKGDLFDKYEFVKEVLDDFRSFERTQITLILEKGTKEGYLGIANVNSTVDVIVMIINSIEIPLFLQNKYKNYENTINELIILIVSGLPKKKK